MTRPPAKARKVRTDDDLLQRLIIHHMNARAYWFNRAQEHYSEHIGDQKIYADRSDFHHDARLFLGKLRHRPVMIFEMVLHIQDNAASLRFRQQRGDALDGVADAVRLRHLRASLPG